jgi:aryl carrier-like protein
MIYTAKSGAERSLNPMDKIINKIDFTDGHYDNEVELILGKDQEAIIENGRVKIIKKLYPYTFRECCDVMGVHVSGELLYDSDDDLTPYENSLVDGLDALRKLIICRDAYWKTSDVTLEDLPVLYTICWDSLTDKMIKKTCRETLNKLLAFPKEDMRDTFARKFENDIIKCKNFI